MISVVIPTLNSAASLPRTLACLVAPTVQGIVKEVIIADGGSLDETLAIAYETGARTVSAARGRGGQLAAGAAAAKGTWILFLHSDTVLAGEWMTEMSAFLDHASSVRRDGVDVAAVFKFRLDDFSASARRIERLVRLRCRLLGLPYGDQGLLISKRFYEKLGGFSPLPLMEDVDLVRRIGRRRLVHLNAEAITSAEKYQSGGYFRRPLRNLFCLALYFAGVPPRAIARLYG
jgi:rSAM/selenodomain-associated transferase 2